MEHDDTGDPSFVEARRIIPLLRHVRRFVWLVEFVLDFLGDHLHAPRRENDREEVNRMEDQIDNDNALDDAVEVLDDGSETLRAIKLVVARAVNFLEEFLSVDTRSLGAHPAHSDSNEIDGMRLVVVPPPELVSFFFSFTTGLRLRSTLCFSLSQLLGEVAMVNVACIAHVVGDAHLGARGSD